jgi:hypothetical protein
LKSQKLSDVRNYQSLEKLNVKSILTTRLTE